MELHTSRYTCVWEFDVHPAHIDTFERAYDGDGAWVTLFRSAPGFIETLLLRDRLVPHRYLTVDRWRDLESYRTFRNEFAEPYERLDRQFAALTVRETSLGEFTESSCC